MNVNKGVEFPFIDRINHSNRLHFKRDRQSVVAILILNTILLCVCNRAILLSDQSLILSAACWLPSYLETKLLNMFHIIAITTISELQHSEVT